MAEYRHELKYTVSEAQLVLLGNRLSGLCRKDENQTADYYTVTSLYFDDINDSCVQENTDGQEVRHKYRIRTYNHSREVIKLERKSNIYGMTSKVSESISLEKCAEIINAGGFVTGPQSKLAAEMLIKGLIPKSVVQYDRTAFVYGTGNVRITFDRNIGGTPDISSFFRENVPVIPLLKNSAGILEIKYDELLPEFIREMLNIDNLHQQPFSKYAMSRNIR